MQVIAVARRGNDRGRSRMSCRRGPSRCWSGRRVAKHDLAVSRNVPPRGRPAGQQRGVRHLRVRFTDADPERVQREIELNVMAWSHWHAGRARTASSRRPWLDLQRVVGRRLSAGARTSPCTRRRKRSSRAYSRDCTRSCAVTGVSRDGAVPGLHADRVPIREQPVRPHADHSRLRVDDR